MRFLLILFSTFFYVKLFFLFYRYSTFIILYPIGVTGELLCLYAAQKEAGETRFLTIELPNFANFVFHYDHLLIFAMFLYIPREYRVVVVLKKKLIHDDNLFQMNGVLSSLGSYKRGVDLHSTSQVVEIKNNTLFFRQ